MASVLDVAAYIVKKFKADHKTITAMKLQKLVYYSQAWHLAWEDEALFPEHIEAWANGPVSPALFEEHRGMFTVETVSGNIENLKAKELSSIDAVLSHYGDKNSFELSELTHREEPWMSARAGLRPGERSQCIIGHDVMQRYYLGLIDF
jgi:uncharacterized phage-associated protein